METKIGHYQAKLFAAIARLRDVRLIGLLMFLAVVLMISWSGVKVIDTNYRLQQQIAGLEQENRLEQLSNTNMKLTNDYYQTDQYLEIQARQNFGMAAPGETVLAVPTHVALSNTKDRPAQATANKPKITSQEPFYQRNFQAWMTFFLHRQPS